MTDLHNSHRVRNHVFAYSPTFPRHGFCFVRSLMFVPRSYYKDGTFQSKREGELQVEGVGVIIDAFVDGKLRLALRKLLW